MQTLLLVTCCVLIAAIFTVGVILDRKNRSAAKLSRSEEATERDWFHAIR